MSADADARRSAEARVYAANRLRYDIAAAGAALTSALDAERGCRVGCIHLDEVLRTADRFLCLWKRREALLAAEPSAPPPLHFVCTDFPGPGNECVFVECEDGAGHGVNAGEWVRRPDGLVALVVSRWPAPDAAVREAAARVAALAEHQTDQHGTPFVTLWGQEGVDAMAALRRSLAARDGGRP